MSLFVVPLQDLQQPLTQAMLATSIGVLGMRQVLKRSLGGRPATIELRVRNPGLIVLSQTAYMAVLESPTGLLADAHYLGRGRVDRIPDELSQLEITLVLECAPASWRGLVRAAANASVAGAAIPRIQVPIIPDPGAGCIAVAFSSSPATPWAAVKASAIAATSYLQQDLTRTPLSSLMNYRTLAVANATLILTVPDGPAVRQAGQYNRAAIIAVSGDRDPTHGVAYAVGVVSYIRPAPGGLIDVFINMAHENLAVAGIVPASAGDQTKLGLPWFDPLIDPNREDLSASVLHGRSATWHIDPWTHEIAMDDFVRGQRVVDLGDHGDHASERKVTVGPPVSHVQATLVVDFAQTAIGICDIANRVNANGDYGALTTLNTSIQAFPASATGGTANQGWNQGIAKVQQSQALSGPFWTGRTFTITYAESVMSWAVSADGKTATSVWSAPAYTTVDHAEQAQVPIASITYLTYQWSYNWTQPRREVCSIVLDLGVQPFALGASILNLGTISCSDPNAVEGIPPFADGTVYNAGDRILVRGKVYECIADGVASFYKAVTRKQRNGFPTTTFETPYWRDLGVSTAMPDPRSPTFLSTSRGRGTIEAVLCRMRAAALRSMGALRISKRFPWTVGRDLSLRDECRMLIRFGDALVPVRGKVEELSKVLDGEEGAWVDVTITVMVGDGRNNPVGATPPTYVQTGYVDPGYTGSNAPKYVSATVPGYVATGTTAGDVEYVLSADPLAVPIDAYNLSNPSYACLSVLFQNSATDQIATMRQLIADGTDPRTATQVSPTTLDVTMRSLRSEGVIIRNHLCHAQLLVNPRGVDLITGGEP